MNATPIATKDNIEIGQIYWFYNNNNYNDICKGRIINIIRHPYLINEHLVIYEWYFRGQKSSRWEFAIISTEDFVKWKLDYLKDALSYPKIKKGAKQDNIKWR